VSPNATALKENTSAVEQSTFNDLDIKRIFPPLGPSGPACWF
jgi:hypothetical protein